jgi:uncharacterized cupredoxin-like copper-binding protein
MRRLALLAAALTMTSCVSGAAAKERVVEITIHHSRFVPAHFEVEQDSVVRFVIRNDDPIAHEFILGDLGVQRRHERGRGHHHGAIPGEISVPAGSTRSTTYTFTDFGALIIGCHLPGHFAYGMRGRVIVR